MTTTKQLTKEEGIIAYKVFNSDWTCRGFQYEVGNTYTMEDSPIACERGFHACEVPVDCFNYYDFNPNNRIAKVLLYGLVAEDGDKLAANKIDIIEEVSWEKLLTLVNTGTANSGNRNSGNRNSGNLNSGDQNSGYWNSGNRNSGDLNSGNWNSGNRNSGNWNSGNRNSGNRNSGDQNSGYWNSGNRNSGYFNTTTPTTVRVFGKDIERELWENSVKPDFLYFGITRWVDEDVMTTQEKIDNPKFFTAGGYLKTIPYKQAFVESFEKAPKEDKKLVLGLPGFDKEMFYEISGIDIDKYDLT